MNGDFYRRKWVTAYAPLFVWTAIILGLGSSVGSMHETSRFIRPLLEYLFPSAAPDTLTLVHGYIRKAAHLFEYAVLAILAINTFRFFRLRVFISLAVVLVIASIDEFNQSFDSARTGTPVDVLIDLVGGLIGLGIWRLFSRN